MAGPSPRSRGTRHLSCSCNPRNPAIAIIRRTAYRSVNATAATHQLAAHPDIGLDLLGISEVVHDRAGPSEPGPVLLRHPGELVGPVLSLDHAPVISRDTVGTYPAWSLTKTYSLGSHLLYDGLPCKAKWTNEGATPADATTDPYGSPWTPRYSTPGELPNSSGRPRGRPRCNRLDRAPLPEDTGA